MLSNNVLLVVNMLLVKEGSKGLVQCARMIVCTGTGWRLRLEGSVQRNVEASGLVGL